MAAIVLVGVGLERAMEPAPADAGEYHRRVRNAAAEFPMRIGNWVGQDVPVPRTAVAMLSPNVIISRRYVNIANGQEASLLLVQCSDARDIVAHYPPICYCNAGWTLNSSTRQQWVVNRLPIDGTEYHFAMKSLDRVGSMVVDDFMVLPTGRIVPNMDAVDEAATDVRRRFFGAAQVQILSREDLPAPQRSEAFAALIGALEPTIAAIGSGGVQ